MGRIKFSFFRSKWARVVVLAGSAFLLAWSGCSDDDDSSNSCAELENACEEAGATSCDGDRVLTCSDNGQGCLVWQETKVCGEHSTCAAGVCQCTDRCIPDERQCVGDMLQHCIQDADGCAFWDDEQDCAENGGRCDDSSGAACVDGEPGCGNGVIDQGELCDGTALGDETCESQGFTGGTLACNETCDGFDTSGCTDDLCGNGVIDLGETCDGTALGDETCETQGQYPGTLLCNDTCDGFDLTNCGGSCGDGEINGPEVCDGTALADQTCQTQGFDEGTLACTEGCDGFDTSNCITITPGGGCGHAVDVTGEEFPYSLTGSFDDDPAAGFSCRSDPTNVVWFVYHPAETADYTIAVTNDATGVSASGLVVFDSANCDPYGSELACVQSNGATASTTLSMTAGSPYLIAFFTDADGTAMKDPAISISRSYTVGWCKLQWPLSITATEGDSVGTYGRLYIAGVTDQSSGPDTHDEIVVQVGVGPDGSDPSLDPTGWSWFATLVNPFFTDASNDEYMGDLLVPDASGSPYDFAYRVSGDSGLTWMYCDGSGNTAADPYDSAQAGDLVANPYAHALIISEYVEGSSNNKALEFYNSTTRAFDLSVCEVRRYNNGAATPSATYTFPSVELAAGDVYVVCHANAGAALQPYCDELNSTPSNFNGDDALEVYCDGVLVDSFGRVGEDPGSYWGTSPYVTQNATLRRLSGITVGDLDSSDAFDPALQWNAYDMDTFDGLGVH